MNPPQYYSLYCIPKIFFSFTLSARNEYYNFSRNTTRYISLVFCAGKSNIKRELHTHAHT